MATTGTSSLLRVPPFDTSDAKVAEIVAPIYTNVKLRVRYFFRTLYNILRGNKIKNSQVDLDWNAT